LTRQSSPPNVSTVSATAASILASSVTSVSTARPCSPRAPAVSYIPSLLAAHATDAPWSANVWAISLPIPPLAPVTNAVIFSSTNDDPLAVNKNVSPG
jgi:hypothetical protein